MKDGKSWESAKRGDLYEPFLWEAHETINPVKQIHVKLSFLGQLLKNIKLVFVRIKLSEENLGFNKRINMFEKVLGKLD